MKRKETMSFILFTAPIYVILFAVLIYPISFCIRMSMSKWHAETGIGKFVGLFHYDFLIHDPNFWNAIKNVLYIACLSIPLEVIIGFSLALLVHRVLLEKGGIVNSLLAVPVFTAPVVAGLFWRWLLDPKLGIINYFLRLIFIEPPPWFASGFWAKNMVVMVSIWQHSPFVMIVMYAGLLSLPKECLEAAVVDGASSFQKLWHVTIPLLKRLFLFIFIIRSADVIKSFDSIYVLTGGGPAASTETPSVFTYNLAFNYLRMDRGAASGIIFLSLSLVFIILFIRVLYLKEKEGF